MGADASVLDDHEVELMNEYKEMMKDKVHRYVVYGIGSAGADVKGVPKEKTFETHDHQGDEDALCAEDLTDLERYCKEIEDSKGVHILQRVQNSIPDNMLTVETVRKEITAMVLETALIDAHLVLYFTGNSQKQSGDWMFSDGTLTYQNVIDIIKTNRRNRFLMVYIVADCCYSGLWVEKNNTAIEAGGKFDPCIRVMSGCGGSKHAKQRHFAQAFWGKASAAERSVLPQVPLMGFEKPFKLPDLHRQWFDDNGRLELPPTVDQESGLHWHGVRHYGDEFRLPVKVCTQCEFDDCFLHCTKCTWRLCMDCYNKRECAIKIFPEGDKYEGQWEAGEFHGEGTFIWVLGKEQYDGCWKKGARHGRGRMAFSNGDFYDGDWLEGERTGEGLYVYANGDRYEGQWQAGQRVGRGTLKYSNGDRFEGQWVADQRVGDAVYTYFNSNVYRGPYVADKKCGMAEYTYKNGDKFIGPYVNDVRCGFGRLICVNGDGYEGEWAQDVMHGRGTYAHRHEGKVLGMGKFLGVYEGEWFRGKKHGQGVFAYTSGDVYSGGWEDGLQSGAGVHTFANGDRYEGSFKKGKVHGHGHYWYADTSEYEGEFFQGRPGGLGYKRYSNGDQYEGSWAHGSYDGQGTKIWAADDSRYDGTWVRGRRQGKGHYVFPSGETYAGDWAQDRAEGMGVFTFLNGNKYIGEFHDDEMDGKGRMVHPNGDSYSGVWRRDKRDPHCPHKKFYRTEDEYVAKWDKGRRVVN
jgi:hypothetical protein